MDPFAVPVLNIKPVKVSKSRSTAPSKLEDLSVGSIRYSFLQMRSCKNLTTDLVLWTGHLAGEFALSYLLMSASMLKKGKKKQKVEKNITGQQTGTESATTV